MATSKRLLPAILLALAACKLSTDDLKPKTDEECALIGGKACGYKCISLDDPTTGCASPSCDACPDGPANSVAACELDLRCGWTCEWGWGNCNGLPEDGCELFVGGDDSANCGACGRICDGTSSCASGMCPAASAAAGGEPRGILHDGGQPGRIFWVDDGSYGEVRAWDALMLTPPYQVAYNLDPRTSSPALSRLALGKDASAAPRLYVTGGLSSGPAYDTAIFEIDPAGVTAPVTIYSSAEAFADEGFQGLATVPGAVFFAREGVVGPCYVVLSPRSVGCVTSDATEPGSIRGLTAAGSAVFFGYPERGGTLSYVDTTLPPFTEGGQVRPIGSWPSRIAIHTTGTGDIVWFWANEGDGSVWFAVPGGRPLLLDSGSGLPAAMDIVADAWGVVWTDYREGKIRAWRSSDKAVFDLASGGGPLGVALSPTRVFWTDSSARTVYSVPK